MEQWNKVIAPKQGEYYWIIIPNYDPDEPVIAHYEDGEFSFIDTYGKADKAGLNAVSYFKHIDKPSDKEWIESKE